MRPIAIGPIKYVTHDTMPAGSGILRCNVSYILRRQVDHGGTSPTIWTGEMGMVRNCDLSVADISILLPITTRGTVGCLKVRNQLLWSMSAVTGRRRALYKTLPSFRHCFPRSFYLFSPSLPRAFLFTPFLFFFFFSLPFFSFSFFFIHRTRETLLSTFVIKVPNSSRATGDAINLKKIINSNFSKTRRAFCRWKSRYSKNPERVSFFPPPPPPRALLRIFFLANLNICGA